MEFTDSPRMSHDYSIGTLQDPLSSSIDEHLSGTLSKFLDESNVKIRPKHVAIKHRRTAKTQFEFPTRIDNLLSARVYANYTHGRENPFDTYEESVTAREWWRTHVKPTPIPGTYELKDFIEDENTKGVPVTCSFLGTGREAKPGIELKGELLQPGLYEFPDFIKNMEKKKVTYSFKSSGRKTLPVGLKDKDLDIAPWQYNISRELIVEPKPSTENTRTSSFRSQICRLTEMIETPKGPPPGAYDPKTPAISPAISSCFVSQTPRFFQIHSKHLRSPGPGAYTSLSQLGNSKKKKIPQTINDMAQLHGVFFSTYNSP